MNDPSEFKAHPWFQGIAWEDMLQKTVNPPYKPKTISALDVSNFDKAFTREKVEESFDFNVLSASPNHYSGFTYKDKASLQTSHNFSDPN